MPRLSVFDILGYFAHFRKHFTTTSSLTYSFPPRTTLVGILAAILGMDRNSYYDLFSSENCKIAIKLLSPVRRSTYTLNYLMTKEIDISSLRGNKPSPAQIHFEVLLSDQNCMEPIGFRIYFNHRNEKIQSELIKRVYEHRFIYPPSLGTVNNLASIEYAGDYEFEEIASSGESVEVCTIVRTSAIEKLNPSSDSRVFIEELVPAEFSKERTLSRVENYIYEGYGKKLKVYLKGCAFKFKSDSGSEMGVFM